LLPFHLRMQHALPTRSTRTQKRTDSACAVLADNDSVSVVASSVHGDAMQLRAVAKSVPLLPLCGRGECRSCSTASMAVVVGAGARRQCAASRQRAADDSLKSNGPSVLTRFSLASNTTTFLSDRPATMPPAQRSSECTSGDGVPRLQREGRGAACAQRDALARQRVRQWREKSCGLSCPVFCAIHLLKSDLRSATSLTASL
jgi:hypothetical protein